MQFMSAFFTLYVATYTIARVKLKNFGMQAEIQPIFPLHTSPSHAFIILFLFGEQISAFSLSVRELLSLFGMHLKCLWINVFASARMWWKFYLRIHARAQIETSAFNGFNAEFIPNSSNYITLPMHECMMCACAYVSNWLTKILLWIWPTKPTKCGTKLKCFNNTQTRTS